MRPFARALLLGAATAVAVGAPALADPAGVYSDYASDGQLSCDHSRGDLSAVLSDASINQYGDPLTLARLKLTIRRQLVAGCGTPVEASVADAPATTDEGSTPVAPPPDGPGGGAEDPSAVDGAHSGSPPPRGTRRRGSRPIGDGPGGDTVEAAPARYGIPPDEEAGGEGTWTPRFLGVLGAALLLLAGAGILTRRSLSRP
jgi:hypothetical protein